MVELKIAGAGAGRGRGRGRVASVGLANHSPGPHHGRSAAGDAAQQRPVSSGQVDTGSYLAGSWCGVRGGATSSFVYSVFIIR